MGFIYHKKHVEYLQTYPLTIFVLSGLWRWGHIVVYQL